MTNQNTVFITRPWEDMPALDEYSKEQISLSAWSLYKIDGKYLMIIPGGCLCCHGGRQTSYWILNEKGEALERGSEDLYRNGNVEEIIKFKIPERITKNYLKISF